MPHLETCQACGSGLAVVYDSNSVYGLNIVRCVVCLTRQRDELQAALEKEKAAAYDARLRMHALEAFVEAFDNVKSVSSADDLVERIKTVSDARAVLRSLEKTP